MGNGSIRPLALGLHAQVSPHLLKEPAPYLIRGDLQLPAQHKPFQHLHPVRRRTGAEQGLGSEFALWVPNQDPERRPLALTKWLRLDRTASRQMHKDLILGPRRRSIGSPMPKTNGPLP